MNNALTFLLFATMAAVLVQSIVLCRTAVRELPLTVRKQGTVSAVTSILFRALAVCVIGTSSLNVPHVQAVGTGWLVVMMVATFIVGLRSCAQHFKKLEDMRNACRQSGRMQSAVSIRACEYLSNATLTWGFTSTVLLMMVGANLRDMLTRM